MEEKRGLSRFKPRIYLGFAMANSWIKHLSTSQALLRQAVDIARESGDLVFMGYALRTLITNLLASGTPLADAQKQIILGTLKHCGGDKRRAAKALGVSLKTLYNRLGIYENEGGEADSSTSTGAEG